MQGFIGVNEVNFFLYIFICDFAQGLNQANSADSFLLLQNRVNMQHKCVNDLLAGDPPQRNHGDIMDIVATVHGSVLS